MKPTIAHVIASLTLAGALACSGGDQPVDDEARDLSLAPAESVGVIDDAPVPPAGTPAPAPAPEPRPQPRPQAPQPRPAAPPPAPPPAPAPPTLLDGTSITLYAADTLTSRHNEVGQEVWALTADAILDEHGDVVIPAGAVFRGTISDLAPAESPGGEGRMALTFNRVEFDGQTFGVQGMVESLATRMKGRGVTAGDAAKVGAGAVVGAIAGRIIGGNRTGTAVGAAAGAAAGVGIAAATRDVDIILDAGAPIVLVLTAPFSAGR